MDVVDVAWNPLIWICQLDHTYFGILHSSPEPLLTSGFPLANKIQQFGSMDATIAACSCHDIT